MAERIVQQPPAQQAQEKFTDLPTAQVERSTFDMSHPWKGTVESKHIVPVLTMEVLPADTMQIRTTAFLRLATPLHPIMDNIQTDLHYMFVPNRIIWDNWQFFMGERTDPSQDPTTVSVPQIKIDLDTSVNSNNLPDYMGLPIHDAGPGTESEVNALPFRAYQKIYNDWYRNQNLQAEFGIPLDDGPDTQSIFGTGWIRERHKKADYFTRALPWPQKGDPVFLPLGNDAPITGLGWYLGNPQNVAGAQAYETDATAMKLYGPSTNSQEVSSLVAEEDPNNPGYPNIRADLTTATAATINDIRTAFQIQRLLERDARGGTRYIEILLSHFNVQSPDFRLQRAEYISGGSSRINVNPIASTFADAGTAPQGNLGAVGTGLVNASMSHSFTEHGWLFCLMSSRADLTYQNGMDRMWSRKTRYDYYWPALSHLGEQAIENQEIFFDPNNLAQNELTWGYQERYSEYRYQPGRITGYFRSNYPTSLDSWHLAQDFNALPVFSIFFINDDPPIDRVVAVPSEPDFLVDVWHDIKATRAMPVYAVPGLVDHF